MRLASTTRKRRAQLVAHRGESLGLGRLALQAVHLPGDFLEDVIHAGEVLLGDSPGAIPPAASSS